LPLLLRAPCFKVARFPWLNEQKKSLAFVDQGLYISNHLVCHYFSLVD
jgi:hypothetical protein